MAGSNREPRQQDDLSHDHRHMRRSARRPELAYRRRRRDPRHPAARYRKSSNFDATAKLLDVNARSLRRQLRQQGISFRGLRDELRAQLALKYLRSTNLANEDIALALGFSDSANFRRAFHRWTGNAPSQIRDE